MRRAQLIGLAGIVVASGLWATPAVGQETLTSNELIRSCAEAIKRGDGVEVAASITVTRPFHPGVRRTPLGSSLDNFR